jgi:prepilin-type N-terminal cleavage/methylation domain-containing protein/prepilin-type processing-associated H-X9-DG protein
MSSPTRRCRSRAFTLIEILVVVAIIALLIAILLPSLSRARAQAKTVVCTTQLQQLMKAALLYKTDFKDRLPGTSRNDSDFEAEYNSGARTDWLTWSGTWTIMTTFENRENTKFWPKVPRNGRLWRYYNDEKILKCPSAETFNGKLSYSTPEAVALAMPAPNKGQPGARPGLPPIMDKVKHPQSAIMFLDESEQSGMSNYSVDDGFGAQDLFGDRHLGKATMAFFDGHAAAYVVPVIPATTTQVAQYFTAQYITIAPFNSKYTFEPWKFKGLASLPKFRCGANFPMSIPNPPGCE